MINGASFGSPFLSMVPDAVLKTMVTAAPHWGTSIPFKRVLCSAQSGPSRMAECFKRRAMSRKRKNSKKIGAPMLHCLNPNAAGVDVGATEIYIAVPVDRDPQPVRHFSTFTGDLHAAVLRRCARVYLLSRTLSGQPGQRRESAVGQNTQGQKSSGHSTAYVPLSRFIAVNPIWGTFIAACAPNSGLRKPSPPRHTSWLASSITW